MRFTFDISNAFLHVPVEEPVTCDPPAEWKEEWIAGGGFPDVVWELLCELYGKRVAPKSWTTWFADLLTDKLGLEQCVEAPWFFKSDERGLQLEVHMDDGHGNTKKKQDAINFLEELGKHVMLKEYFIHEVGSRCEHLKRPIELTEVGALVGSNPRYAEKLLDMLGESGDQLFPLPSWSTPRKRRRPRSC